MRIFTLITAVLLLCPASFAQSYGIFGGFNSTVYDSDNVDFDREFGLEFGFTALIPIQSGFLFRTGAGFAGKNSSVDNGANVGLTYLQFPATVMVVASPTVSLFGGLNLNLLISDSCEWSGGGSCTVNSESMMISLPLGARFRIQGPHYIEPIIEFGMTDALEGTLQSTKMGNSLAVRYAYMF